MFKLPFKKTVRLPTKFLTLGINSQSIKCLAFYKENGTIKIIGSSYQPIEEDCVRGGNIVDFDHVVEAAQNAITETTQDLGDKIEHVIFGISSEMSIEGVITAQVDRGSTGIIDDREMQEILDRTLESAFIQAQNRLAETTGETDTDLDLVTSTAVYTKVNGREIPDLEGTEARSLETAYYTAYCPSLHIKNLQRLAKKLDVQILAMGSELFALTKALEKVAPSATKDIEKAYDELKSHFTSARAEEMKKNKPLYFG